MKFVKLGSIIDIISGFAFKSALFNERGDGIPLVRVRDVNTGFAGIYYSGEYDEAFVIKNGDLLIGLDGDFKCIEWKQGTALLNQRVCKIIPKRDLTCYSYILHFLPAALNEIHRSTNYTTVKHLSTKTISEIKIPLPPLPIQLHIANLLSKAEHLIAQRKESIRLLDDYLKSVFLVMFGDPIQNVKGFDFTNIGAISTAVKDGPHVSPSYEDVGIPILSTRNIRPGKLILDEMKYVSHETYYELTKRFKPQKGDILLTKGGTTGYAKVVDFDFTFCIWVHLAVIRLKKNINPIYIEHALNSDFCYHQSQKYTHGITNKDLGLTRIVNIQLLLPPFILQTHFAQIVKRVKFLKTQYQWSLQELENLYGSLKQKAFKGELTVSEG